MISTLLISMLVFLPIAIIIAVVVIQSKKRSERKKNEMIRVYRKLVFDHNLNAIEEVMLNDKVLAVDAQKKVFVFVHNHDKPVYDVIQLAGLSGCKVVKKGTNTIAHRNGRPVTELHVNEVQLSFLSGQSEVTNLRLYSEIFDGTQEFLPLTKLADDWQLKLDKIIKS